MLTLGNLTFFLLLATLGAWLWHSYGIRERALLAVRRHCERERVELLDDNVAFRRLGRVADAKGRKRLARVYGFEFTVTGEQRHPGSIVMFGGRVGHIELAPHPFRPAVVEPEPVAHVQPRPQGPHTWQPQQPQQPQQRQSPQPPRAGAGQVIRLEDWRRQHGGRKSKPE